MKILVFDIGNSSTKLAIFDGEKRIKRETLAIEQVFVWLRSIGFDRPDHVIISSVTKSHNSLIQWLESHRIPVEELTHTTPLPFVNGYSTPETLGKDRLAGVGGAHALYPGQACLVIDVGTCIKYDYIDANGVYHGGNIAPGIQMRIDAMHHFTSKLPTVPKEWPQTKLGISTVTALQHGALTGAALETKGFIEYFAKHFGKMHVLITGGDSGFLLPHLEGLGIISQPDIVLTGLHHILKHKLKA